MTTQVAELHGIYSIPEAARYLISAPPLTNGNSVKFTKVRYWIRTGVSLVKPVNFPDRRLYVSFRDLISMRLIAALRSRGMRIDNIKRTEAWMRDYFRVDWPLIWRPLWTYGSQAYTEFERVLVSPSQSGQLAMEFIRKWLKQVELDMTFDANDFAQTWSPSQGVRIDPSVQLGDPCVDGTRIPTKVIWGKIQAGDTVKIVSNLYGLSELQIDHALEWERRLLAAKS